MSLFSLISMWFFINVQPKKKPSKTDKDKQKKEELEKKAAEEGE